MPIFLQQWNKEVDTHLHILEDLLFLHTAISNSNPHTKNLLELKLHHCFCFINLWLQGFLMSHQCWKLTCIQKDIRKLQNSSQPMYNDNQNKKLGTTKKSLLISRTKFCKYFAFQIFIRPNLFIKKKSEDQVINQCTSKGKADLCQTKT